MKKVERGRGHEFMAAAVWKSLNLVELKPYLLNVAWFPVAFSVQEADPKIRRPFNKGLKTCMTRYSWGCDFGVG